MLRFTQTSTLRRSLAAATTTRATSAAIPIPRPGVSVRLVSSGGKDYYKILGVSRSALPNEIKKAYRKRALETHPDQGGKKEEFAEVAEAYECLSNEEKRRIYDQYGSEAAANMSAAGGMGGFGGRSAEDIFAEFFKDYLGGFNGGARHGPPQVPPIEVKLRMTLEDVYKGAVKSARVNRPEICSDCRGFGTKNHTPKPKCAECDGNGHVVHQHRLGPGMVQQTVAQCPRCGGSGSVAKPEDQCLKCRGLGYRHTVQDVSIDVPAGVPANVTLVVRGEGGTMPNTEPGDLHVNIEVASNKTFTRRGDDLLVMREISLSEALLGLRISLKLLDGRVIVVKVPDNVILKPDSVLKIPGEGMPNVNGGRGNLYVIVRLKMPQKLTDKQKEAIISAFGEPKGDIKEPAENIVTARVMRESAHELEDSLREQWDAQDGGGGGGGGGGDGHGHGRGGGGGGGNHERGRRRQSQAQCVHQ